MMTILVAKLVIAVRAIRLDPYPPVGEPICDVAGV
jgi:hypothetical protein